MNLTYDEVVKLSEVFNVLKNIRKQTADWTYCRFCFSSEDESLVNDEDNCVLSSVNKVLFDWQYFKPNNFEPYSFGALFKDLGLKD